MYVCINTQHGEEDVRYLSHRYYFFDDVVFVRVHNEKKRTNEERRNKGNMME